MKGVAVFHEKKMEDKGEGEGKGRFCLVENPIPLLFVDKIPS